MNALEVAVSRRLPLAFKAVVLLQLKDAADVFDAARRELVAVFPHFVRGLRKHQVATFAPAGPQVPAVQALVVLKEANQQT